MAGNDDTVQVEFYAPWPNFGVKLSQQWGEIRTDTSHLAPLVRAAGLDASGDFSDLDGVEQTALQAWELGEDGFHNKIRHYWNKDLDRIEIQSNVPPGTEGVPNWYTVWAVDDDGVITQITSATTATSLGTGADVYKEKVGTDLKFRSIIGSGVLTATQNTNDITLTSSAEANTYSSDQAAAPSGEPNTGVEIILSDSGKTGVDLPFKAIKAGPNVIVRNTGTAIEIESTAQVVEFYGIRVSDTSFINTFPEVHHMVFNREDFYLTQETTNPSNKTIIVNSISDPFNSNDYVAVIGDDMTGQLAMHDGTVGEPSIGFTLEQDTGIYRKAANDLAIAVGGADVARFLSDRVYFPQDLQVLADGTAAGPDIYWSTNSTTGLFQNTPGDDSIAFATAGVRAGYFDANQDLVLDYDLHVRKVNARVVEAGYGTFYTQAIADKFLARRDGTVNAVAFGWEADPDMGLFRHTNGNLHFAKGGVTTLAISSTQIYPTLPIRASTGGTLSAPIYSFDAENNTGMYQNAVGTLDFAVDGTRVAYLGTSSLNVTGTMTSSDVATGNYVRSSTWGSYLTPAFGWTASTTTGMYYNSGDGGTVGFSCQGVDVMQLSRTGSTNNSIEVQLATATTLQVGTGTASYPAITFGLSAHTTGLYAKAADSLGFSTGNTGASPGVGTEAGYITSAQIWYFSKQLRAGDGTVGGPTFSWSGDTTTGMYRPGASRVGFACAGSYAGEFRGDGATPYINSAGVIRASLAAADDPTAPHYTFGSDTTSGLYLPVAGEVGITVSNVKELSVTSSGVTATTNFITVDEAYGASWDSSLTVPTKNALYDKIETLSSDIPPAFYGVIFKESEVGGAVMQDNTLVVDSGYFYLRGRSDSKPLLSLQGSPTFDSVNVTDDAYAADWDGDTSVATKNAIYDKIQTVVAGLGEVNTMSNLGNGAGVYFQKDGVNFEMKSIRAKDPTVSITNSVDEIFVSATGTFYTPVSVQGADPSLTVGNAGATDSVVKFYDEGTLAYTMGWDESASAFKIASGVLDDTNDEVTITDELVEVKHSLKAARVEAGIGTFYAGANVGGDLTMIGATTGSQTGGRILLTNEAYKTNSAALSFVGDEDTGMYRQAADRLRFVAGGAVVQELGSTYTKFLQQALLNTGGGSASAPLLGFNSDTNTGIYQHSSGGDGLDIATGGARSATFTQDGLEVYNDINAGKVTAGHGHFYSSSGDAFLAHPIMRCGVANGVTNFATPQISFDGNATARSSGLGYNHLNGYPFFSYGGSFKMFWASTYCASAVQFRVYNMAESTPQHSFQSDPNTGLWNDSTRPDELHFVTGGVDRGQVFDDGMIIYGDIHAGGEVDGQVGTFYTALHIGGHTPGGDADNAEMWKLYQPDTTDDLVIAPTLQITNSPPQLKLDAQTKLWDSFPDLSGAGIIPILKFDPTIAFGSGATSRGIVGISFDETITYANGQPQGFGVYDTSEWVSEGSITLGTWNLFAANATFSTTTASAQHIAPYCFTAHPTFVSTNVTSTVPTKFGLVWCRGFSAVPSFDSTGASGNLTVDRWDSFISYSELSTNDAAGTVTVTEFNDIKLQPATSTGTGTETITTRNYINMADETFSTNVNGINSAISSGANKYFINHTGTAVSTFGGAITAPAYNLTSPTSYTQTYATASTTHAGRTAPAAGAGTGADATTFSGAQCDALVADQQNTAQVLNQLIDDLQAIGLIG